ncbi:MAG TPA: peptide ABC transporter substrate-binding protein [Clostridia bacterium]|jgi:oligopeptide transport system substrate-binding protein|nr:peptide ABC transporter substrate-binding protein [Clostridia bacterium]HQA97908.1 peptide ABC transporter substrate-binding protein [Clostridia bacterium]HQO56093.1 peptide ABC transporter substrate-binding protein [Clostridia bacterium]HUM61580.1 peptide ABC transporter substrate-binding protein [Clostridia bacterium]
MRNHHIMRTLALALALLLVSSFLVATAQTSYQTEYKSTFSGNITSMNPYTTEALSDYMFIANLIDGLVETDIYGRPVPSLALSWESSEDKSVWTFKLRPDVYWVDAEGNKTEYQVTAEDFVSGLRYVADPKNTASNFSTIRGVIAGLYDYYKLLAAIDDGEDKGMTREEAERSFDETVGVKALDELTVQYTLSASYPFFLSFAQLDLLLPVKQAFLDQVGKDFGTGRDKLLYNGGYYISQWDLDKQLTFSKNPHYWDLDKLTLDTLSWEYVSDGVSRLEMFQRGNVTSTSLTSEEVASIRGTEWENYVYLSEKTATTYWFSFNFATRNPEAAAAMHNVDFRKAVFTAIDAVTISAIWEPEDPEFFTRYTLLPENTMFDPDGVDYTDYPALQPYKGQDPFDEEAARALMKNAVLSLCEADGVTLKGVEACQVDMLPIADFKVDGKLPIDLVFSSGSSETEMKKAALVKEMLETYLGKEYINVILGHSTSSFSADVLDRGNWDLYDDSYGFRYADPSANMNRLISEYDITESSYQVPEFDAMVQEANSKTDIKERYALFSQAEAWMIREAYVKPYMTGGGSYNMTRIVPFTEPGGYFGMSRYKMKGALIQETPVTARQHLELQQAHEAQRALLAQEP